MLYGLADMKKPASILITGASSGIGAALARIYAEPGTRLFLGGRDVNRLAQVALDCREGGAEVASHIVDVTDDKAMERWVCECDDVASLDLVIANAGISGGTGDGGENADQTRRMFAVNVDGVVNTAMPAISRMCKRGSGQVALMSSLVGFRGFPGAPAYSASKAAVRIWGEALSSAYAADGIGVSVIYPGFIKTPMTDGNRYAMPFIMSAGRAALIIRRGLGRNRPRIAFPWPVHAAIRLLGALPHAISSRIMARLPKKE